MKLTMKQEKFVLGLIEGKSQRQAYIDAGYSVGKASENQIDVQASKLFANTKVYTRYQELLKDFQSKSLWTREEALEEYRWLKDKAKGQIEIEGVKHALATAYLGSLDGMNKLVFEDDTRNRKIETEIKMLERKIDALDKEIEGAETTEDKLENYLEVLGDTIDKT